MTDRPGFEFGEEAHACDLALVEFIERRCPVAAELVKLRAAVDIESAETCGEDIRDLMAQIEISLGRVESVILGSRRRGGKAVAFGAADGKGQIGAVGARGEAKHAATGVKAARLDLGKAVQAVLGGAQALDIDDPGDRVLTKACGLRTLEHLDATKPGICQPAEIEAAAAAGGISHVDAVDQHRHIGTAKATNAQRRGCAERAVARGRDARLKGQEIPKPRGGGVAHLIGGQYLDGGAAAFERCVGLVGGDCDGVEFKRVLRGRGRCRARRARKGWWFADMSFTVPQYRSPASVFQGAKSLERTWPLRKR